MNIIKLRGLITGALLGLTLVTSAQAYPIAVSTFSGGDEGWRVVGDAQSGSAVPSYNAAGYVYARDDVAGGVWYWSAPGKFLGNVTAAYGQKLEFKLMETYCDNPFDSNDIILEGGGKTLAYVFGGRPNTTWTNYSVSLSESAGWKTVGTGIAPSQAEFKSVLSSLTSLRIRGEYNTGPDTGSLDDVVLNAVPEPSSLVALAGMALGFVGLAKRKA